MDTAQYIFYNVNLEPALISGFVSLLIAGLSGAYILFRTSRKLSNFRNELLEEVRVKRFSDSSVLFFESYKSYKIELSQLSSDIRNAENSADGTAIVQHVHNFFGEAKFFYDENKSIMTSNVIDNKLKEVQLIIDSGILNDFSSGERMKQLNDFFTTSASVIEEIRKAAIK